MADALSALSQGSVDLIFNNPDEATKKFPVPVLQCLQIKQMGPSAPGVDRYRIVVSDGQHYVQCMLGTQANHVIHDGSLVTGSIVRMKQFNANSLKGKNVLIILDLEVITSYGVLEKLGKPVGMDAKASAETTETAAAENTGNRTIASNDFYGAKKEESKPSVQSVPQTMHAGNNIYPIEGLSPFAHKWTIKARVTSKSDVKRWQKPTGEGKLFSMNLLDESGEIKATGFNQQCDDFYDLFEEGCVYYISSPCRVSHAKKQFSNLPHDYEIAFERDTIIEKAEDQKSVPQIRFNFCTLQELQGVEKDNTVDVIGILKDVGDVDQIISKKTQQPFDKRELSIVDDTGYKVPITVWGKTATSFDVNPESVVAFKGTKVSDFNGKSLSLLSSGTMTVDPDIPDAHRLKGWYDSAGRANNFATHRDLSSVGGATGRKDEIKTVAQVIDETMALEDQIYYTVKATIIYVTQKNFCYPACSSANCNKKVIDIGGAWRCEKCNVDHPEPEYRYILSINVADHTNQQWLNCFDDVGRKILGISANELVKLQDDVDDSKFLAVFDRASCQKLNFRCRAKMDTFGDVPRVRYQVMSATPMDFKAEGDRLAEMIKQYNMDA